MENFSHEIPDFLAKFLKVEKIRDVAGDPENPDFTLEDFKSALDDLTTQERALCTFILSEQVREKQIAEANDD